MLAGRGPDEEAIKQRVAELGLQDVTVFTGHLTDTEALDALYSIADLFVFPSIYDNAPMVVREAAAQRTPALTAEGSCTAEVITNGVNGIISKDESPAVAEAIISYLALPEERRKEMGDKAYETIPIPWDGPLMDTILGRYQALIESNNLKYRKSL